MPGGSKEGGGLITKKSTLYKKQKFGEAVSPFAMKYKRSAFPFGGAVVNSLSAVNNDIARQAMKNTEETSQITNQSWMGGDWWNKRD